MYCLFWILNFVFQCVYFYWLCEINKGVFFNIIIIIIIVIITIFLWSVTRLQIFQIFFFIVYFDWISCLKFCIFNVYKTWISCVWNVKLISPSKPELFSGIKSSVCLCVLSLRVLWSVCCLFEPKRSFIVNCNQRVDWVRKELKSNQRVHFVNRVLK